MKKAAWVMLCFMSLRLLPAADHDSQAKAILGAVDRPVGLVHLPRCGSGELALALLEADKTLCVHGQDADDGAVLTARKAAHAKGYHGRRAWFDQGTLARLLPVARSCDLVIITNLKEEDLTSALASEISRVLHPWYGVALLAGNVSDDKLLQWGKTFGASIKADLSLLSLGSGRFLKLSRAPLEGSDNWSHFWHGPDNNAVSNDTAYSFPETIQWTGEPDDATRIDIPIIADGRVFTLYNGHVLDVSLGEPVLPGEEVTPKNTTDSLKKQRGPVLVARAVGSGARLWHKRMSPAMWLQAARSVVVADGGQLLVGEGGALLELDQATGKELRRIDMDCEEIKWIAAADGYVALVGGPATMKPIRREKENVIPFRSSGLQLSVLDRKNLKTLWREKREKGPEAFDPRSPAIADGRLFICTEGCRAEAYDLPKGQPLWRTEKAVDRGMKVSYEWDRTTRHPVSGYAIAGLYVLAASEMERCAVLSQKDGHAMWELERGRGAVAPVPMYYLDQLWIWNVAVDMVTGKEIRKISAKVEGCGHFTAAPQGLVSQRGLTWNAQTDEPAPLAPFPKSACGPSTLVANGLIWRFPNGVWHINEWRGFIVRGPAERNLPSPGARLTRTVTTASPGAEVGGWTAYRGNPTRSASTAAPIADTATLLWSVSPDHPAQVEPEGGSLLSAEALPVPPVTGGNTVIAASHDGAILALDLKTGHKQWQAFTGGRIESSPAIWKDRVFAGSADGHVYAFSLENGKELWRLRVAAEAGRMMLYDQLGSRWPVFGSPMVADGKVFAAAGCLHALDGIHVIAADAISGERQWERNDMTDAKGGSLMPESLIAGNGQFSWDKEFREAVFRAGVGLPVRLSLGDGAARMALPEEGAQKFKGGWTPGGARGTIVAGTGGPDIGKLGPDWMVLGGTRMLYPLLSATCFVSQGDTGAGRLPILVAQDCTEMPSWDSQDMLLTLLADRHKTQTLALVSMAGLKAFLRSQAAGEGKKAPPAHVRVNLHAQIKDMNGWSTDLVGKGKTCGAALTQNAALSLTRSEDKKGAESAQLIALRRTDGEKLWSVNLPAEPILNGLAVAADGSVIVALEDGRIVCAGKGK